MLCIQNVMNDAKFHNIGITKPSSDTHPLAPAKKNSARSDIHNIPSYIGFSLNMLNEQFSEKCNTKKTSVTF